MLKGLIILFCLSSVSTIANSASKLICISGTDDNYIKAEVTLDDKKVVFDSTLYLDGEKISIGSDDLIILRKNGRIFYSKSVTNHFVFYRKALISNDKSHITLEEAQISGDLLLSALSTSYDCTQR
jgi:hypothetical protein